MDVHALMMQQICTRILRTSMREGKLALPIALFPEVMTLPASKCGRSGRYTDSTSKVTVQSAFVACLGPLEMCRGTFECDTKPCGVEDAGPSDFVMSTVWVRIRPMKP